MYRNPKLLPLLEPRILARPKLDDPALDQTAGRSSSPTPIFSFSFSYTPYGHHHRYRCVAGILFIAGDYLCYIYCYDHYLEAHLVRAAFGNPFSGFWTVHFFAAV